MKKLFLFTLLLINGFGLFAQAINWKADSKIELIGKKLQILEDPEGKLSFSEVSSIEMANKFKPSEKLILNFGFTTSFYWLKFNLNNPTDNTAKLEVAQACLPIANLYYYDSTHTLVTLNAGYSIPLEDKLERNHFQVFSLPKGNYEYFLKLKTNSQPIPIFVCNQATYEIKTYKQKLTYGFYLGFMLFVILSNIFFFFSLRNRMYLFYAFVVLIYIAYEALVMDGFIVYYFPKVDLLFWFLTVPTIGVAVQLIYCVYFLEVKKYSPRLNKFAWAVIIYFTSYVFIKFFIPLKIVMAINTVNALISFFLMGFIGYKVGKKGNKIGFYFAWAYFIYFLLVLTEATYVQTGSPSYFFELSHVGLATLIEAFILSFLLSKKFEWEKEDLEKSKIEAKEKLLESTIENERIVKEQNILLEQKVNERTAELNATLNDLKNTQTQLVQNEKLASLGQLTAGIAHEINNPINFVSSNISPLKRDFNDLEIIYKRYKESGIKPNDAILEKMITDMDVEYTFKEIKELLNGIEEGAKRTAEIVKGLKTFARTDEQKKSEYSIQEGLEGTILLLNSKLINKEIIIEKQFEQLPLLKCFAGKINQVFMNIISNAIDASNQKGKILIKTWCEDNQIAISISDNGSGMSSEIKSKIFDPFFTTKDVGSGTGLGLSITYGIIESHNGKIEVESELEKGTSFIIYLPL